MDKKVGVSILFGFLFLAILIGVSRAAVDSDVGGGMLNNVSIVLYGDAFDIDNTTLGGASEIVNLTVAFDHVNNTDGLTNITNISVYWEGNYTFLGWVSANDAFNKACTTQDAEAVGCGDNTANSTFTNVTLANGNGAHDGDWACFNATTNIINCLNNSAEGELGPTGNVSLVIRFNVTAASGVEEDELWNVTVIANNGADSNDTTLTTYVDGLAPRLYELNITDGNTTWTNGTFNGSIASGFSAFLTNNSDLTVTATIYEQNPEETKFLYWNGTDINAGISPEYDTGLYVGGSQSNGTKVSFATATVGALTDYAAGQHAHAIKYTWTIPANSVYNFGESATGNQSIAFVLNFNDTLNQVTTLNDTTAVNGAVAPFSILLNDTLPYVYNITFIDANGNNRYGGEQTDGTSDYLYEGNITIQIDVSGMPRPTNTTISNNSDILFVYYNTTGALTSATNGDISTSDEKMDILDFNITNKDSDNPLGRVTFETSINLGGNASNDVQVYVVIGNKTADLNEADISLAGNYTNEALFKFTLDGSTPGAELNTPTVRGLGLSDSIQYVCTGSDSQSGVNKYTWFLQKPGGSFVQIAETSTSSGTNSQTFSGNDISAAGNYNVRCRVTDNVGNTKEVDTTSTNQFTVSISSSGSGSDGGAGGTGGAAVSFDVDFTSAPQATFKASQGRVKSFSFDGVTKHTITFNEVTANGVTLVIASDPVTVTLNAGQSKSVDVNADGTDDMKVQLNGVENGVADVTVTKLEEGAAKVKAQEEEARGVTETGEREVTPVAGGSLAWLWWTLIVIVAIVAIGYYVNKRK